MTFCDMALMMIDDILGYVLVHHIPIKSLSQEPMSGPIPDDHNHHVTYEAQPHDIFLGAPTGVTLHH